MAGYKITFDGSLNERRDVAQVTSVGSLSYLVINTLSPSKWENPANDWTIAGPSTGVGAWHNYGTYPNTYDNSLAYAASTGATVSYVGGIIRINNVKDLANTVSNNGIVIFTPNGIGQVNFEIRHRCLSNFGQMTVRVAQNAVRNVNAGTPSGGVLASRADNFSTYNLNTWYVDSGSYNVLANQWINFSFGHSNNSATTYEIDYIRITTSSGGVINITPSTPTPGVAPTGGVASSANAFTTTNGQASILGSAKLFGAKVIHDMNEIAEAKYYPPADSNQDAQLSMSETEIITATSTSLSVESEGLGGSDKLTSGSTSVIVEELLGAVEN